MNKKNSLLNKFNIKNLNPKSSFLIATVTFLIFTLAMFYPVLFTKEDIILSSKGTDLYLMFMPFIKFGFGEIKKGNLPLWCPHIFCGYPFFGNFQSALLYPLNLLHLLLPLSKGINWTIALHIFLSGVFTYLWISRRKIHFLASLISSLLFMFCGAYFLRIYAGHIPFLNASVWTPLIFYSIEGFQDNKSSGWCLLGTFAITMQILAGYPQILFFTFIAVLIYTAFNMIKAKDRFIILAGLFYMYGGASLISAVQLFTGLDASRETIRNAGVSYDFATSFSFSPENLITFISPGFFGDLTNFDYWGRWYFWEVTAFISITGLILALYGVIYGDREKKKFYLYIIIILFILSLGKYTPLYKILYDFLPFFDKFRSPCKFMLQISLFAVMLSAIGLDHLIKTGKTPVKFSLFLLISGIFAGIVSLFLRHISKATDPEMIVKFTDFICRTGESFNPLIYHNVVFMREAGCFAFKSLLISSVIIIILSLLFYLTKYSRKVTCLIALLAIIEIFFFARNSLETFNPVGTELPVLEEFAAFHSGDYRIANYGSPDLALYTGLNHIWGYDPTPLKRYAEFMASIHGSNPDDPGGFSLPSSYMINSLYGMLRCKFILLSGPANTLNISEIKSLTPLERFHLTGRYRVIKERDKIFSAIKDPAFKPEEEVILEEMPDPEPEGTEGTVKIRDSSTDHIIIEADIEESTILLITDTYSKDWHARGLPGSSQTEYRVMPADYIFRAIPLSRGHHIILLEYRPIAFRIGLWVSVVSLILYIILLLIYVTGKRGLQRKKRA